MHFSTLTLLSLVLFSILASSALAQPASVKNLSKSKKSTTNPLKARAPQPSRRMGKRASAQTALGPSKKDYSAFLCNDKAVACPVPKAGELRAAVKEAELTTLKDWFKVGFECLDVKEDASSCGGCTSLGKGQDCNLIPNVRDANCNAGACVISSCTDGWAVGRDGKSCVKRGGSRR